MKKILMLLLIGMMALSYIPNVSALDYFEIRECRFAHRATYYESREACSIATDECVFACDGDRACRSACYYERRDCRREASTIYREARQDCSKDPECLLPENADGEEFTMGCDVCSCNSRGKLRCKTDNFCNRDVEVAESTCEDNGGFFSRLCRGPYFGVVCSQDEYCVCGGINEYSCSEDYECLTEFISPVRTNFKIGGFRDLLGRDLGEIGVCAAPLETPMEPSEPAQEEA